MSVTTQSCSYGIISDKTQVLDIISVNTYNNLIKNSREAIAVNRTLVAYFSASGTTKRVAQKLAAATGADIYEIKPETPYTAADLNWQDRRSRSSVEMNDPASRPGLADTSANINEYDRVFVGFPIWWGTAPKIVRTFLESYDFNGKPIALFATSGGSGMGRTAADLAASCPGADIKDSRLLRSGASEAALRCWAEGV